MDLKIILCVSLIGVVQSVHEGYSFSKFIGPVSGQVHRVEVPAAEYQHGSYGHHQRGHSELNNVDFIAKPDYKYAYGVEDPHTGNQQTHQESRDGDAVSGEYSVVQPDGVVRTVKYVADSINGFRASVYYNGQLAE